MANATESTDLWDLTTKRLLLLHGQASVEHGLSINKEISVENMAEQTLIAQRVIKDHLIKVLLSKELPASASSARQRYQT